MLNSFHGLPVEFLENDYLRVEYLTSAGPRVVRLFLRDHEENLLAETPEIRWPTPFDADFQLYGGHRLWLAPEDSYTSYPDNQAPHIERDGQRVLLTQVPDSIKGIEKSLEILLPSTGARAILNHRVTNRGQASVRMANWAITQLPLGGEAYLPYRHPGAAELGLQPDRNLVLWPYSSWKDTRLRLTDQQITILAQPRPEALKLGILNQLGWIEYRRNGIYLRKFFRPEPAAVYPDLGCNVEVYVRDRFIELETLGPLTILEPGESQTHQEIWEIRAQPDSFPEK